MPSFKYIVVNKENKQLAGVVDAPSVDIAQKDLTQLGFSIISIEEQAKGEEEEGTVFEFKGIDSAKRNIAGTIKSESRYLAYKRLISEYELEVKYVVQANLSAKEKLKQKQEGIKVLMEKENEGGKKKKEEIEKKKRENSEKEFNKKKAILVKQVEHIIKKVNEALELFATELKPEEKQKIVDHVNKILRLKNSTNVDYIKNSCSEVLKLLQNPEIFINPKTQITEKFKLYAESLYMIDNLEKGKDFGVRKNLEDKLLEWQAENIEGKKTISITNKMKNLAFSFIIKVIHKPAAIRKIHNELFLLTKETRQYYGVYLKAQNIEYKKESVKSLKTIKARKARLLEKLQKLKAEDKRKRKESANLSIFESILDSINGISGWLLFFYLILYFISGIIVSKEIFFGINEIPTILFLFQTGLIKHVLPIIFLLHITTSFKLNYFKKNFIADVVLFPAFAILSLIVIFNF